MNYYHVDMLRYCDLLSSRYVDILISYHVEMQILDTVIYSKLLVIIEPRLQTPHSFIGAAAVSAVILTPGSGGAETIFCCFWFSFKKTTPLILRLFKISHFWSNLLQNWYNLEKIIYYLFSICAHCTAHYSYNTQGSRTWLFCILLSWCWIDT